MYGKDIEAQRHFITDHLSRCGNQERSDQSFAGVEAMESISI